MLIIFKSLIIGLIVILILMLLDFILAVSIRLKTGKFDWKLFLNFMKTGLLPYILIWAVLAGINIGIPYLIAWLGFDIGLETIIPLTSITGLVWAALITKSVASIFAKFKEIGIELKNQ
ncbi:MAG: hypothetical protein M1308_23645 [Actinobacteria bacterium]|nr:hypothetical protein [Actinomycetota bacterium]